MAGSFSAKEARELIAAHRTLKQQLGYSGGISVIYRGDVLKAGEAMKRAEVLRLLSEVPIEELSREKKGYRVKALRDGGCCTMADALRFTEKQLADINGISGEGAADIRKTAEELAAAAYDGARVRLSADDKNPAATEMIKALCRYGSCLPQIDICKKLLGDYGLPVEQAITDLEPAQKGFRRLFLSRDKKEKAEEAYRYLTDMMAGEYGRTGRNTVGFLDFLKNLSDADAWKDFESVPIEYITLTEKLCPGLLGKSDALGGLPDALAKAVGETPLHLEGLRCTLRHYQEWGTKYILCRKRVLLGDEMGLGKTVQAIAAMVSLRNDGGTHFLVVCPASVLTNWCREIRKHSDLSVIRIHGDDRDEMLEKWKKEGGAAVTTYETTGAFSLSDDFRITMMTVDEAHYIKNPAAKRTANVKLIGRHAERLLFMTGTALENRVDEMVTLIRILQPEVAKSVAGMESLAAAPQFREKVAPVYYRRRREDVLTELPDLIENTDWCDLLPEEQQVYEEAVLSRSFADARRVSWNMDDMTKSSKARRLLEIIEDAEEDGRKIIVFSFFLDTIRKVTAMLGEKCLEPINGSVPPQRRQEIVDQFNEAPAGTVLAAQIQSGGTGLNIQAASVVILCEPQFKPSTENQAISRAYRMGQTRSVYVHRLLCDETVDERITDILAQKQAEFDAFADESSAARESLEMDQKTFGTVMEDEIRRIRERSLSAAKSVSDAPVFDTPVSDTPVSDVPVSDAPVSDAPVSDVPVSDTPVSDTPVSDVPVSDAPVSDTPVSDTPVSDAPVSDTPVSDTVPAASAAQE